MYLNPFILGLSPSIPASPFLPTESLYDQVGHNTGNLAFHYAIDQILGPNLDISGWYSTPTENQPSGKVAVVPCANQLGPHLDLGSLAYRFQALPYPLIAVGLGAQAGTDGKLPDVPKGTQDWIRTMADKSHSSNPNIGVRGNFTRTVLSHLGLDEKVTVLGCPTLFINPDPELGKKIAVKFSERTPKHIAVTAGHQRWTHLARIEESLTQILTATGGSYIGQSPLEMVKLTRGEAENLSPQALSDCRQYCCPSLDDEEFKHWSRAHGRVFFDVPAWMEYYRKFDFIVGTRIHGVMLGLQTGVPSLCIVHDSRTLELCQTMKVPHVMAKDVIHGISRSRLFKLFKFDPDEFDNNRLSLGFAFSKFFQDNCIKPNQTHRHFFESAQP